MNSKEINGCDSFDGHEMNSSQAISTTPKTNEESSNNNEVDK